MTEAGFRRIALSQFAATEGSHMGHADFRVGGRIFASLPPPLKDQPKAAIGMVKLTQTQQRTFSKEKPAAFLAAQGAWGKQGCTYVRLSKTDAATLRRAVDAAWRNAAPKRLLEAIEVTGTHK